MQQFRFDLSTIFCFRIFKLEGFITMIVIYLEASAMWSNGDKGKQKQNFDK